jgi:hypothetical protein
VGVEKFKLVRELDFPNQFRAGHQDSAKGGKFQFPHEQDGFSTRPSACGKAKKLINPTKYLYLQIQTEII